MDMRTAQVFNGEIWQNIAWEDIKEGMLIRIFETTGEPVADGDQTVFTATSDSYMHEEWEVWTFESIKEGTEEDEE